MRLPVPALLVLAACLPTPAPAPECASDEVLTHRGDAFTCVKQPTTDGFVAPPATTCPAGSALRWESPIWICDPSPAPYSPTAQTEWPGREDL